MNTSKIIKGVVGGGRYTVTAPITQWDYGYIFQPIIEDLPTTYRLDFSNDEHQGTAYPVYCGADGGEVPQSLIDTGKDIFVWLFYIGDGFGKTEYKWRIPNKLKPKNEEEQPEPSQQSSIDQLIVRSNEAVESAEQSAEEAGQSAQSAKGDADRAESASDTAGGFATQAQTSANNASASASQASASARASAQSASQSAQIKSDVEGMVDDAQASADASYQNAQTAERYAQDSATSARQAESYANGASGYASQASASEQTASSKASEASQSAQAASQKATEASQSASQALTYKTDAESAKTASQTAQGLAESARDTAVQAKTDAESARDEAQGIVDGISGKVEQIDSNTERIESLEDDRYKPYVTDSASGSIASFPDGADGIPLKSLVVDIDPVQDLHGQDSPYPAGGGKNLLPPVVASGTLFGVTYVATADGTVTLNGTCTTSNNIVLNKNFSLKAGTYSLCDFAKGSFPNNYSARTQLYDANSGVALNTRNVDESNAISSASLTEEADITYRIWIENGFTYNNCVLKPMLQSGEQTSMTFAPYENICPISGWTEVDPNISGINVWDEEWEVGGIEPANGRNNEHTNRLRSKNYIPCKPNTTYWFKKADNAQSYRTVYYDKAQTFIESSNSMSASAEFTTPDNCYFVRFFSMNPVYSGDISINYPSTDHSYHPYTGRSITIDLGQTVYDGKLDVLTGKLVVDRAKYIESGQANWIGGSAGNSWRWFADVFNPLATIPTSQSELSKAMSDKFKATYTVWSDTQTTVGFLPRGARLWIRFGADTELTTAQKVKEWFTTNPTEFVYELVTPIEIQLSENQLNSLYGQNNIWADSGDAEVEYRADTRLYIEKLTRPEEDDMVADSAISEGQFFMIGNSLYKALTAIASGATITIGTNAQRVSLSDALNLVNT